MSTMYNTFMGQSVMSTMYNTFIEQSVMWTMYNTFVEQSVMSTMHNTFMEQSVMWTMYNTFMEQSVMSTMYNTFMEQSVMWTLYYSYSILKTSSKGRPLVVRRGDSQLASRAERKRVPPVRRMPRSLNMKDNFQPLLCGNLNLGNIYLSLYLLATYFIHCL